MTTSLKWKLATLVLMTAVTVMIHYGLVLEPLFGHASWIHSIHSRLCYVPIAVGATWFGLRGGLLSAAGISLLVVPFVAGAAGEHADIASEMVEFIYYFAIGGLIGALTDREALLKEKHDEAQRQLDRAHRLSMAGQVAAGVAHEIRNPLASIKGAIEIVTDPKVNDAEKLEFREILITEVRRIDSTVKEFLELARPKVLNKEPINFSALVVQTLRQLQAQLKAKGAAIEQHIIPELHILGDAEKLKQLLINIVINAAESTEKDLRLVVRLTEDSDSGTVLSVGDNGPGMSTEQLERIFEPFFTTKPSGSGLGLAVVKNIVDLHGGEIEVQSKEGRGTVVRVFLPREVRPLEATV